MMESEGYLIPIWQWGRGRVKPFYEGDKENSSRFIFMHTFDGHVFKTKTQLLISSFQNCPHIRDTLAYSPT